MMRKMSHSAGPSGREQAGGEVFPAGEATPALPAQAIRAQKLVFLVMLFLIALPVAVWIIFNP